MSLLAQAGGGASARPGFADNQVLDEFYVPFGDWMGQAIEWILSDLRWLLSAIRWPFVTLNDFLVKDVMQPLSWFWIVLAFFVIGSLARNLKVGVFAGAALGFCGILGPEYWDATIETIGFVVVAVILCVIIGIPVGILCGRVDAAWQVIRPVLDAMQVVHAFVYMLPFIAFFGLGNVGATIVTMAFALPPLVRLTNLGIRQVPEDVVEASRAYGAPEWRVLVDVQLPLARAAIMTGLNQTVLLAMSMLAIAAIMGAQGLGALLFSAISRQSVTEGAAAGLAFYLVAVVFDRISQPEGSGSGGLRRRVQRAWAHRLDPESLLPASDGSEAVDEEDSSVRSSIAPLESAERKPILVAAAGGFVAAVSVLFTWSTDAGFVSAYGRAGDESRVGESFSGLSASGGSWFGILTLVLGLFVVVAAILTIFRPGRGPRWFTADGAVIAAVALAVMVVAFLLAAPSDLAVDHSSGPGPWLALVGAVVASGGAVMWIRRARHAAFRPLSARVGWGRVMLAAFAVIVLGVGAVSAWSFDERERVIIDPGLQAQLDEMEARAEANPEQAGVIAADVAALDEQLRADSRIIVDGVSGDGAGLGVWAFLAGLAGLAAALPAAGVFGRNEHRQWRWSSITAGIGAGVACIGFGWIFSHVRSADENYVSGVGSFLAMVGGLVLVATAGAVLREFRRARVYADDVAVEA